MKVKAKSPYNDALVITYIEGDNSLERIPPQFVDDYDDKLHTIRDEETLTSISNIYYNTGRNWHIIADKNSLDDIFSLITGNKLIIPNPNNL